jgi:hypothetical protein
LNTAEQQPVAEITADMSLQNLDLANLVVDSSSDMGKVYIGSTAAGGVDGITNVSGPADLYLRSNSGLNIHTLNDYNGDADIWGDAVKIDDNNNIALVEFSSIGIYLYIWRDPEVFSGDTYDEKVLLTRNYIGTSTDANSASVGVLGDNKFIVCWTISRGWPYNTYEQVVQIIDNQGNIIGDDIILNSTATRSYNESISRVSNNTFMVTWYSNMDLDNITTGDYALAQLFNTDGTKIGTSFLVNEPSYSIDQPSVDALSDGRFVFIFYDGNSEQVFYRIWDPNTSAFVGASVQVNLIDSNNIAGYYQRVAADDIGGFGVMIGGYNNTLSTSDIFFQKYNSQLEPFYTLAQDIIVNNNATDWYDDMFNLAYHKGGYQFAWDFDTNAATGVAYRRIPDIGDKEPIIIIDQAYRNRTAYNITMAVDKNGVPLVVWPRSLNADNSDWSIAGFWGPVPNATADRVGYCPNATNLSQVNSSCSGVSYTQVGSGNLTWSPPLMSFVDFKLADVNSGGAFVDSPPAVAFKDFSNNMTISSYLYVSWYDLDSLSDGTIRFYYDTDNVGFNGTQFGTEFLGSSLTNSAQLDASEIPDGTYWVYVAIDDGVYPVNRSYAPYSITKTQGQAMMCTSRNVCYGQHYYVLDEFSTPYETDDPDCSSSVVCDKTYTSGQSPYNASYCGVNDGCDCWWVSQQCTPSPKTITLSSSLDGVLVQDSSVDIETEGSMGIKNVLLRFATDNKPLAEISADFTDNRNWTTMTSGKIGGESQGG